MTTFALLSLGGLAFALICAAGGLWALIHQHVVVDKNGQITEFELPFFGKLKTNAPALVAIMLGSAIAYVVVTRVPVETDRIPLVAEVTVKDTPRGTAVVVGAIPNRYLRSSNVPVSGERHEVFFDVDRGDDYTVIAYTVLPRADSSTSFDVVQGPARPGATEPGIRFTGTLSGSDRN